MNLREWSFIPGGGGLEPRRGGSLWIFENKREGHNDKHNPYWGGPSKNVVACIRYVRIFINLVGFRVMKFQNFLQPWWKRTFLIYAKLDEFGGFRLMEFQFFLQPWWREIFLVYYANLSIYAKLDHSRRFKQWDFRIFFNHGFSYLCQIGSIWRVSGDEISKFSLTMVKRSFGCTPTLSIKLSKCYR